MGGQRGTFENRRNARAERRSYQLHQPRRRHASAFGRGPWPPRDRAFGECVSLLSDDGFQRCSVANTYRVRFFVFFFQLLKNRADINFTNEHGNTPLHYACFWGYEAIAEELIENGALAALANKDGDTPLDKGKGTIVKHLKGSNAQTLNQTDFYSSAIPTRN